MSPSASRSGIWRAISAQKESAEGKSESLARLRKPARHRREEGSLAQVLSRKEPVGKLPLRGADALMAGPFAGGVAVEPDAESDEDEREDGLPPQGGDGLL